MKKFILLVNTVKYLKIRQIFFRLYYSARAKIRNIFGFKYIFSKESKSTTLKFIKSCASYSVFRDNEFNLLNLSKRFDDKIDWNYKDYGKLWTYNLAYFEYLREKSDLNLIYDFIDHISNIKEGLEPFPISLRGINWIKFLTAYAIEDKKIDDSLYAQYYILLNNLEYHLFGNHLLENGFSLLFGAYYFKDEKLYAKATVILKTELDEQILEDGGHFELSPMYHQIMLFRVLDCINLLQNNSWKNSELLTYLKKKASIMLGWLQNITYKNGNIPLLNDSANHIAPTSNELFDYANNLNVSMVNKKLGKSGYRKVLKDRYECILDVGYIGASYIPGHAHSDTFNFELNIDKKSFIVDSGLSTYEINERRFYERSTKAHNTVEVLKKDSSEVWGGFRVGNRAVVTEIIEKQNYIRATHDGYKKDYVLHTRSWKFETNKIIIVDELNKEIDATVRFHFHPDIKEEEILKRVSIENSTFKIKNYMYACEFNKLATAKYIEINFNKNCRVKISI